ncbi:hypothetical protein P4H65_13655 [Paenibacillus chitinolyticus]|uniref:hypothetical protein n=1 Tax=Paenibacillus chitinolyticus TaxID=79263 RepID=UPI002DB6C636|nr:hypothetical protein [Paenibacillus chitinolyticus]MEC0246835.1 hypothetical protein [Paenibacillus chitinolyticus]
MKANLVKQAAVCALLAASLLAGCGAPEQNVQVKEPSRPDSVRTASPSPGAAASGNVLDKLRLKISHAKEAREVTVFLDENMPKADKATADQMFIELQQFYDTHLPGLNASFTEMMGQPGTADKMREIGYPADFNKIVNDDTLKQWLKNQAAAKLQLSDKEGSYLWKVDYDALNKSYSPYVSDDLKAYLAIQSLETETPFRSDASLKISRDELGERTLAAEKALTAYPKGPKAEEIKALYSDYLHEYIHGYRYEAIEEPGMKLIPLVKQSYEKLVKNNPDTKTAGIVKEYLTVINANKDVIYTPGKKGESVIGDPKPGIETFWKGLDARIAAAFPDVKTAN